MSIFASAAAVLFADPNLGQDATWKPGGVGGGVPVRVILRRPDRVVGFGGSRALLPSVFIDVRQAQVPAAAEGDTVTIGSVVYEIIATPVSDALGLVWTCEAAVRP